MAFRRQTRESQGVASDHAHRGGIQDRNAVRQLAAGLDREGAELENERKRLLEERRQYFRQTEADLPESIPSPKFNDPTSQPSHRNKAGRTPKLHQLQVLLNQIVRESGQQNAEVQRGLANLREAHLRVIRNLDADDQPRSRHSRKASGTDAGNYVDRFRDLKSLIDDIMKDCQIENEGVRKSLRNIRNLQEEAEEEIEYRHERRERTDQGRHRQTQPDQDKRWKEKHEADIRELAPQLLISDSSQEAGGVDKLEPQSSRIPSSLPSVQEQLEGLDDIESRIFYEVLTLRDEKIKLLHDLNEEIKHSNSLTRQLKRFERETGRGHRHEDSENESIINKLGHGDSEIVRLRKQVRILERELERAYNKSNKNESTRVSGGYEKTIAKLQNALNNADFEINELRRLNSDLQNRPNGRRGDDSQLVASLRENVRKLEARLREEQDRYAQLQSTVGDYGSLQDGIIKLRDQNEELRVETIRLLKSKETDTAELNNEIARLQKKLAEGDQSRARFTDEIGGYINRIKTGQEIVERSYATYGTSGYGTFPARFGGYDDTNINTGVPVGGSYGSYNSYETRLDSYKSPTEDLSANLNVY